MSITRTETQVTWPTAANSKSVAPNSNEMSEEFNLDETCVNAQITVKAENGASPASDDYLLIYLRQTSGDPDGSGSDEFDTAGHALCIGRLDTNKDNPAIFTAILPIPQKGAKLYAEGGHADGTTNAITVSATITEQRAA